MKYVIDTETTGINYDDEILQLAIRDFNNKLVFNKFFKPETKRKWEDAEKINGISPKNVRFKKPIEHYKDKILGILENADAIIGYNTNFDIEKLNRGLGCKLPYNPDFDVMMLNAKTIGGSRHTRRKLTETAADFKFKWSKKAHDAAADTEATLYCYKKLTNTKLTAAETFKQFYLKYAKIILIVILCAVVAIAAMRMDKKDNAESETKTELQSHE